MIEAECVGCDPCARVCQVEACITMRPAETGLPYPGWGGHAGNPAKA